MDFAVRVDLVVHDLVDRDLAVREDLGVREDSAVHVDSVDHEDSAARVDSAVREDSVVHDWVDRDLAVHEDSVVHGDSVVHEDFVAHEDSAVRAVDRAFAVAYRFEAYELLVVVDVVLEINVLLREEVDRVGPEYATNCMDYAVMAKVLGSVTAAPLDLELAEEPLDYSAVMVKPSLFI